jgi:ATP-dependent RNA helicase RhlE
MARESMLKGSRMSSTTNCRTMPSYVHRVGRTARAGAAGVALSFCDASEVLMLNRTTDQHKLPSVEDHSIPQLLHSVQAAWYPLVPYGGEL